MRFPQFIRKHPILFGIGVAIVIWIPFHLKKKHDREINRVERCLNIQKLPLSLEILKTDFDSWFNDITTVEFLIPKSEHEEILSGRDWKKLPARTHLPPEGAPDGDPLEFWMWQKLNDKAELWIFEEKSQFRVYLFNIQFYESGLEFSEKDNVSGSLPFPNNSTIETDPED